MDQRAPTVNTLHPHAHAKVAAGTNRTPAAKNTKYLANLVMIHSFL
jgi:hypothetical protein